MNRAVYRILLATGALAIAGGALWFLFGPVVGWLGGADLDLLDAKDCIAAVGTIRGQVATVLSAAFVAGGLYYTGRKFVLDRDKQYTDRFTNAVDQLGSPDVTVRAGGLRALDRILHDSPRDRDRVLRTVTGYLRSHPVGETVPDDVVAALATLRGRGKAQREVLDLRGIVLPHADLAGLDLAGTDLTGADLSGASLRDTNLSGARLDRAVLRKVDLTAAKLDNAHAIRAVLAHSAIRDSDLGGCDLTDADLSESDLAGTRLDGATLTNTNLGGADLRTASGLTQDQLRRTRSNPATSFPPDLG